MQRFYEVIEPFQLNTWAVDYNNLLINIFGTNQKVFLNKKGYFITVKQNAVFQLIASNKKVLIHNQEYECINDIVIKDMNLVCAKINYTDKKNNSPEFHRFKSGLIKIAINHLNKYCNLIHNFFKERCIGDKPLIAESLSKIRIGQIIGSIQFIKLLEDEKDYVNAANSVLDTFDLLITCAGGRAFINNGLTESKFIFLLLSNVYIIES